MLHSKFKYIVAFTISTLVLTGCGTTSDSAEEQLPSTSPRVHLTSNTTSIDYNGSLTLSWSTTGNADSCIASGDWSGSKSTSGSQTISAIYSDSRYVLNCTGSSGTSNDTVSITVQHSNGTALLSWTPPTENTDNSALIDLAGYKIYYGTAPGSYSNTVTLAGTGLTSYLIENLAVATWYFTMTAYNSSSIESSYANEMSKTIH